MPENPAEERGPYKRRQYDPYKHCGHPMDRSRERYEGDQQKAHAVLDELAVIASERALTFPEEARRKRKLRTIEFAQKKLELLDRDGPDDRDEGDAVLPRGRARGPIFPLSPCR